MAGTASLGKLSVEIGGDTTGLDRAGERAREVVREMDGMFRRLKFVVGAATGTLGAFGLAWKVAAAGAVTAIAGVSLALSRIGDSSKELDTLAQQTGLVARELGVLKQAAEETGVSTEALARGLSQWSDSSSDAAFALGELGIRLKDADGTIRDMSAVLGDVATKFASWQDGATKAELATRLFGESGRALIPILNQGVEGVQKLGERAQTTGKIIDQDAIRAARELSTEWQRLKNSVYALATDWANAFAQWITPALRELVKLTADGVDGIRNLMRALFGIGNTKLQGLVEELRSVDKQISILQEKKAGFEEAFKVSPARRALMNQIGEAQGMIQELEARRTDIEREMGNTIARPVDKREAPPQVDTQAEQLKRMRAELDQFMADYFGEVPWVQDWNLILNTVGYEDALKRLEDAEKKGVLTSEQFTKRKADLARQEQQNIYETASMLGTTLTAVFSKNKAAAIAAAVINTGVAITRTLAQVPYPYDLIQAGLVAAQGAAQIAAIRSTSQEGGGSTPSVSSGGGSAGAAAAAGADTGGDMGRSLHIQGVDPAHIFSGQAVEGLISAINEAVSNGVTLITTENLRT